MDVIEKIKKAGVVGCGGAGFPTDRKLRGTIEYLIINGAECEPLLRTDRYLMQHKAPELVEAISAIGDCLHIPNCVIGLKSSYTKEIAALKAAIEAAGAKITLHEMESFYPAGDEQTLVYEVTGRVVPPAALPIAAGCVVDNIATMLAVYDAIHDRPFTWKYLTVTGLVKKPTVLFVPVGTSYRRCLELAGGTTASRYFLVSGGPMMGKPCTMEEAETAVVTKTTSGILVLPEDGYHARANAVQLSNMLRQARSACIQCSACTELCPRHLLGHPLQPHKIMRKMAMGGELPTLLEDPDIRRAQLCCECGVCEVVACPMGLKPRTINAWLKRELGAAGIRYPAAAEPTAVSPDREDRKLPTQKAAARTGVLPWYHTEIETLTTDAPTQVEIPVRMHIGAPSTPVVQAGDTVRQGELIARCPEGALGAEIHASISGRVTRVGQRIVITRE